MNLLFFDFISDNPWILIVLMLILCAFYIFYDFKKRKENISDYSDAFKYDLKKLIITFVFLTLPMIIAIIMVSNQKGTQQEDTMTFFLGYGVIATVVLAIIRKDPVFLLWWKIPSLSLFGIGGYNRVNEFESNDGGNTWQQTGSHVEADGVKTVGIILGILLAIFKAMVFVVYAMCALIVNMGLAFIYVPVFLGLTIYNGVKSR